MTSFITALARAMRNLAQPRILAVLFVPMLGAIVLWSVLAIFFWDAWTETFRDLVEGTAVMRWLVARGVTWVLESLSVVAVIALLIPATLITAILITELIAMPVVVSVASRSYSALEKRSGGSALGSLANAATGVSIFVLLWLVTLPLWLTGVGAVLLPPLLSAYLNQRLFRYDALAEHASRDEYVEIVKRNKTRLYLLGLILAPLFYIPFVNLAAPVIAGLAFTHYGLAALEALRSDPRRLSAR
jgi:hypothetical protein